MQVPYAARGGCGPATTESSNLSQRGSTPRQPASSVSSLRGYRIEGSTLLLHGRGPGSSPGGSTKVRSQSLDHVRACYRVGREMWAVRAILLWPKLRRQVVYRPVVVRGPLRGVLERVSAGIEGEFGLGWRPGLGSCGCLCWQFQAQEDGLNTGGSVNNAMISRRAPQGQRSTSTSHTCRIHSAHS